MKIKSTQKLLAATLAIGLLGGISATRVFGQSFWQAGDGNWSNPSNWEGNAIPAAGDDVYFVSAFASGETVTLDINVSVGNVIGEFSESAPAANLIIPGTSLTATGEMGIGTLTVDSGGSVSVPGGIGAITVNANNGTLTASVSASNANIQNSSVSGLTISSQSGSSVIASLTLTDTEVGSLAGGVQGTFAISDSVVDGVFALDAQGKSTITDSFLSHTSITVEDGVSLQIDDTSITSDDGSIRVSGGFADLTNNSSVKNLSVLDVEHGGSSTLDKSIVTLGATGSNLVMIDDASDIIPSTLFVQNSAQLLDNGNVASLMRLQNGKLNVSSGGVVSIHQVFSIGDIVVSGPDSALTADSILSISSGGTLQIDSGGFVGTDNLSVGSPGFSGKPDTTASITISDTGSELDNSYPNEADFYGSLSISNGAAVNNTGSLSMNDGPLNITGGGSLTASAITLGQIADVAADIDGAGSTVTVQNQFTIDGSSVVDVENGAKIDITGTGTGKGLFLGSSVFSPGIASMTIETGGVVNAANVDIGQVEDSTALLIVDGIGSRLNYTGTLIIGDNGDGTLALENGGTLDSVQAPIIANNEGSRGEFTPAPNTQTTFTGTLTVGNGGNGFMTIAGDALVSSDAATIGSEATSTGAVTVTDGGSVWTVAGNLTVADRGAGSLTIQNGGVVNNGILVSGTAATVGNQTGSMGTVLVSGAKSQWNDGGDLTIGNNGQGTLTVQQGASVSNAAGTLGEAADSVGTVTVTDAGTLWASSVDLVVGNGGTGTLTIENAAEVTNSGDGTLGDQQNSQGAANVTGATWTNGGSLTVAGNGTGDLTISQGGVVSSNSGTVGESSSGAGTVTISGSGSQWNVDGPLTIGGAGSGALSVTQGSSVTSSSATIGEMTSGTGSVVLGGSGAAWTNSSSLTVGGAGTGTLQIQSGATVSNSTGKVGDELNSQGTVNVDGGTWTNSGNLTIADTGTGAMTITGNGYVSDVGGGTIGGNTGAKGTVTLQGTGSDSKMPSWYNNGPLKIGDSGNGQLNVLDDALVTSESGAIGGANGGVGVVKVDGKGSQWMANAHGDTGIIEIGENGTGKLTVSNQGQVIANTINVDANGTLDGVGGILMANIEVKGGTVSPGDPGTMTIAGNFSLDAASNLTLEVAGPDDYDSLNISGSGTIDGVVNIDFLNGYAPSAGTSFEFISDTGGSFNPVGVNFIGVTPGMYSTDLIAGFDLMATSNWTAVPEPATTGMMLIIACATLLRRRRRSREAS